MILASIGIVFIILTSQLPEPKFVTSTVGAKLFPYIASIGLTLCGLGLVIRNKRAQEPFLTKNGWIRIAKMSVVVIAYPFLLRYCGFIVSSLVLLFGLIWLFDLEKKESILKKIIFTVVTTAVVFVVFKYALQIKLPSGELFDLIFRG